jgi:hypothetical protein
MLRSLERSLDPMSHTSYIETQVYSPMRQIHQDISTKSYYAEPAKAYIGKSLVFHILRTRFDTPTMVIHAMPQFQPVFSSEIKGA